LINKEFLFHHRRADRVIDSQVPNSISYDKLDNDKVSLVWHFRELGENDVLIDHIKQYLLYPTAVANEKLGKFKEGLTIRKVVSDYLRLFHKTGLEQLKLKEAFRKTTYFKDFDKKNIRYSLICSQDQQVFMRECFFQAGIIDVTDPVHRLVFTTKSEASGYHYLAWDRSENYIVAGENYLVCDIGHNAISISSIQAHNTESASKVNLLAEYPEAGSMSLERNLQSYLESNMFRLNLNEMIIDAAVQEFVKKIKISNDLARERQIYLNLVS
jgi:hypothetical protein